MASILRSSKFVRYIAGFAKNVVVNTPREFDGNLVNTAAVQCYCGAVPRTLTTQTSTQHDQNLERRLRTLDQDVRRSGRISRRDIEDVLEEIRNARSASSSQSLLVIRCCGSLVPEELPEVRTKLVQEIWNTLIKLNVPMDVSHYNALLRVYLENEHPFSPTDFLGDMESKGIEPNRVTYQRLISRYCQDGDIEGATKILEYMREKQMPVNENVFNALIFGHSQAGDMDSAHGILAVMTQAGLEPSADTYTTLLCGYAKKGDNEKITELINDCEKAEVYLLDKDYLDIVYSLSTNGHDQFVPDILSKVKKAIGYNQDAINLILRLINKGFEAAAFEVLKTMPRSNLPDGSIMPVGVFFIKQLVKANRPIDTILNYCNKLEQEELYEKGLSLAAEVSLGLGKENLAYVLLEQLKQKGIEIRQHFFWPLIVSKANDPTGKEVVKVLQKMQSFDLIPNNETLREWVLPNLKGKSSEILALLREANVSVAASSSGLVINLLQRHEIVEAATIASSVNAYYNPDLVRKPLTNALYSSENVDAYVTILRSIYDNLDRKTLLNDSRNFFDKAEVLGHFLLDLSSNQKNFSNFIPAVLEKVVEQGLSISTSCAEKIESKLGEKMTEQISDLLAKLTSGELTPIPQTSKPSYVPFNQMNIPQLERLIQNLSSKNQDTSGLKRQLLTLYYRAKDLEKMEELVEELKNNPKFEFVSGVYAQLMDANVFHGNLDRALELLETIKKIEGDKFVLDEYKIVRLAGLFVKNGRLEDGIKTLEETPRDQNERGYSYTSLVWRTLNSLAEEGRIEDLNRIFDTLVKKHFIDVSNVVLGPLIKVHIVNNDLESALERFEWCVNQHKATPWKNELACKLIQHEDAEKLQKLTDLSTAIHGEMNSLYDLVFAFVECGRIRQARKILETPGLQNRPQRINNACERFQQEGLIKPLEGLKDATKDLNYIDRSDIYYQLLLSYIKQNDAEKCLGLWTQMQEEDLAATDQFLLKLGSFLQEEGLEVPFAIPQPKIKQRPVTEPVTEPVTIRTPEKPVRPRQPLNNLKQKLSNGDLDGCLKLIRNSQEKYSIGDTSQLIEKLLHENRLTDATNLTLSLLQKGSFPIQKIFRFLLNKLAAAGDVESLNNIGEKLSTDIKRLVSFDNRLCHANIVAGKVGDYLNKLESDIDNATNDSLSIISSQFPRGGAYGILEKYPEYTDKYEQIAIKYANKGIIGPLNVLWTKNFISNNTEKADEVWRTYLKDSPRIMFQKIVHTSREKQDENLIQKLINHLKISTVTIGAMGNAYSCYLDVLAAKNKSEDVVRVFETALNDVKIENINRTAILRVKDVYEKLGKPFDYPIPPKNKTATQEYEEE